MTIITIVFVLAVGGDVWIQRFQTERYHHRWQWYTCNYRPCADLPVAGMSPCIHPIAAI